MFERFASHEEPAYDHPWEGGRFQAPRGCRAINIGNRLIIAEARPWAGLRHEPLAAQTLGEF